MHRAPVLPHLPPPAAGSEGAADLLGQLIPPREALARIAAQTQTARVQRQAGDALDAFGHATMVVRPVDGRRLWQTGLARTLRHEYFGGEGRFAPLPRCRRRNRCWSAAAGAA